MKKWTKEEECKLIKLYNKMNNDELMACFDRTYLSIYKKARKLNLYKSKEIETINRRNAKIGDKASNWKGGRKITQKGYVFVLKRDHPRAKRNEGYVFEHILVMEKTLKRFLHDGEIVHHKNEIKSDNRIENLELMTHGEHTKLHHIGAKRSIETRKKISEKAIERYKNKTERGYLNE